MTNNPEWDIPIEQFKWRILRTVKVKGEDKGIYAAYPDARTVANHLDRIFGAENWQDDYEITRSEDGVICYLRVKINDEWVTKTDVGVMSDIESLKGGFSDAFKRAAAKLGVGRNAYEIPEIWGDVQNGKFMPRRDKDGRPYEHFLLEQARAKLGKEDPIGEYDAAPAEQAPAPEPEVTPELNVTADEWATVKSHLDELDNERKERVKQWWASSGTGGKPGRDMPRETFDKFFEYVLAESLEQDNLIKTGEAFDG